MNKKVGITIVLVLCLIAGLVIGFGVYKDLNSNNEEPQPKPSDKIKPGEYGDKEFNIKLIKTTNSTQTGNYLISPYSIEIALNMLRDGAKENSEKQISNLIGTRNIPVFKAQNRISVTNGTFIRERYKDAISNDFYNKLKNYDAEIIYDKFETPDKINNWVKDKTYGMIPKILDDMSPDFVLGLANAVAIDVKWLSEFECYSTAGEDFKKEDGNKFKTEMMHHTFENLYTRYFETDDAKGVVLPYDSYGENGEYSETGTRLEFVGILPNKDVNTYINNLTDDKLDQLENSVTTTSEADIVVALPRFTYSFNLANFKDVLKAMGITEVFDPDNANLTGIAKFDDGNLYVSEAIHKTFIDLNEQGTKAAAVTYFGMDKNASMPLERKKVSITFDRPFVYMIRDSKTKEILFFGVVREPNVWKGSTCKDE